MGPWEKEGEGGYVNIVDAGTREGGRVHVILKGSTQRSSS